MSNYPELVNKTNSDYLHIYNKSTTFFHIVVSLESQIISLKNNWGTEKLSNSPEQTDLNQTKPMTHSTALSTNLKIATLYIKPLQIFPHLTSRKKLRSQHSSFLKQSKTKQQIDEGEQEVLQSGNKSP